MSNTYWIMSPRANSKPISLRSILNFSPVNTNISNLIRPIISWNENPVL